MHAIRQGKIGGGESHVIDLVEALDNEKYESIVLSFTDGPMISRMKSLGVRTYIIPTEKPFNFTRWGAVERILEKESIDIVHAHGTRANSNTFFSARKRKIPLVYTVHGWSFHPDQTPLLRWLRIRGERFLVDKADLTVCVSDNNYRDALKLFPVRSAKVVKYGINLKRFSPDVSLGDIREELGIGKKTVLVGYIVRMTIQKDPLTLVRAIALLPEALDMKFLFVGDGDLKDDTVNLAKQLGVSHRIIFTGFRMDVSNVLKGIDVYCLPSLWEGLPIGMLEAMAMGKSVITTSVDGAKEVIENNVNGLLVSPQSPDELAEALIELGRSPALRNELGGKALKTIVENFNVEKMTRQLEEVYNDLTWDDSIKY